MKFTLCVTTAGHCQCFSVGVSHFVAYEADELLVDEAGAIAANYRRQRLALDFISAFPFDWVAYAVAAAAAAAVVAAPETAGSLPDQAAAVAGSGDLASTSAAAAAAAAVAAAGGGGGILPAAASLKALHLVRIVGSWVVCHSRIVSGSVTTAINKKLVY